MGRVILFLIKSEDEKRSLNWTHFGVLDISLLFVLCILIIFFFFFNFSDEARSNRCEFFADCSFSFARKDLRFG